MAKPKPPPAPPTAPPKAASPKPPTGDDSSQAWKNESLSLGTRVQDWISQQGYPDEFKAAEILRRQGFVVRQGRHVAGDNGRNALELDAIASTKAGSCVFQLLVECKFITSPKAWVAFNDTHVPPSTGLDGFGRSSSAQHVEKALQEEFAALRDTYKWAQPPAIALRTMGKPDDAFDAVQSLVEKTLGLLAANARVSADKKDWSEEPPVLVLPVLVVNGELAEATWLPEKQEFRCTAVDRIWLAWEGHDRWPPPFCTVAAVRLSALEGFARELWPRAEAWCVTMESCRQRQVEFEGVIENVLGKYQR